ncbi:hypothetical protein [Bradyrhizobium sp. STM 3562]|uniref:hypothetical protein n=1 Tax=Bradyrhizobium sp. STM 3562 TaxID=578924 RepID=UPI0038900F91
MADQAHEETQGVGRVAWRNVIAGAVLTAMLGVYLFLRKLPKKSKPDPATPVVMADTEVQQDDPVTAFEPTDWELRPVAVIYIGLLALLAISCVVLIVAYPDALPDVSRTLHINPPGPRLQTNPEADLERFRAEEAQRLNSYYWIDKQKGIVHIPIEQAMKKLAQTGIDGFPKAQQ